MRMETPMSALSERKLFLWSLHGREHFLAYQWQYFRCCHLCCERISISAHITTRLFLVDDLFSLRAIEQCFKEQTQSALNVIDIASCIPTHALCVLCERSPECGK